MARKGVQGYTEKSYYDNTRYTGMVSTLDPLVEGSFRHLVNFDISDTNQSLEPREGFLTTSLAADDAVDPITLSSQTIMYKDQSTQRHIVFDLGNHKAYLVDVSAYNVHNNMIPFEREINLDYSELQQIYVEWYSKDLNQTPPDPFNTTLTHTKFVGKVATIFDEVLSKAIHIIPIEFTPTQDKSLKLFMTLTFRNKQAIVNGETLPGDTLLIGAINFKDIGSYNPLERNIF